MDMAAKGDEAHMDILRQGGDCLHHSSLASRELVLTHTGVDKEEVHRGMGLHGPVECVFDLQRDQECEGPC